MVFKLPPNPKKSFYDSCWEGVGESKHFCFSTIPVICTIPFIFLYVTLTCLHTHLRKFWQPPLVPLQGPIIWRCRSGQDFFFPTSVAKVERREISLLSQKRKAEVPSGCQPCKSRKRLLHFLLAKPESCTPALRLNLTLNPDWCVELCTAYLFETCTVSNHICW